MRVQFNRLRSVTHNIFLLVPRGYEAQLLGLVRRFTRASRLFARPPRNIMLQSSGSLHGLKERGLLLDGRDGPRDASLGWTPRRREKAPEETQGVRNDDFQNFTSNQTDRQRTAQVRHRHAHESPTWKLATNAFRESCPPTNPHPSTCLISHDSSCNHETSNWVPPRCIVRAAMLRGLSVGRDLFIFIIPPKRTPTIAYPNNIHLSTRYSTT